MKYFVIPSNAKLEKKLRRNCLLSACRFQGARPAHMRVASSRCCFPGELVTFVRPRELVGFDPQHEIHFPPIGKRI